VLGLERKQKNVEALQKDPTSIPDSTWKSHPVKVIKSYSKLINYLIINSSIKILISSFFFLFSATFESAEAKSTKLKDSLHLELDTDTDKEQDSQNLNHLAESTSNIIVPTTSVHGMIILLYIITIHTFFLDFLLNYN
jgi:hypothetical protein